MPTLSDSLSADLVCVGKSLAAGVLPDELMLAGVIRELHKLPSEIIGWADSKIAEVAHLHRVHLDRRPSVFRFFRERHTSLDLLYEMPMLAPLYVFHRDGYAREAALNLLSEAPASPFFLAAIAYRLNDWAGPVRTAAQRYAERSLQSTPPQVIADAAHFLLDRAYHWGRWSPYDISIINQMFERTDVAVILAKKFSANVTGPLGRTLRYALRAPSLDDYLYPLFRDAKLPIVRAVALKTLIESRASWQVGFGREWIDKRFNLSRRVPLLEYRDIQHQFPVEDLIELNRLRGRGV